MTVSIPLTGLNRALEPLKSYPALAATLFIVGCTSPEDHQHAQIMNKIEKQVQLPSGAGQMSQFARAYKFESPSRIAAFYFVPDNPYGVGFCQEVKSDGPTNGQIAMVCPPPDGMKAGERRWFGDDVFLPNALDGGCNYIDVEYDLKANVVMYVRCHGHG